MTNVRADFEVFEPKGQEYPVHVYAYTAYDPKLVANLKRCTTAKFVRRNGRPAWKVEKDSRTLARFVEEMASAAERAAPKAPAQMTREQLAKWYDGVNEGGEGYNPYRAG